jgi:hypothetical protein
MSALAVADGSASAMSAKASIKRLMQRSYAFAAHDASCESLLVPILMVMRRDAFATLVGLAVLTLVAATSSAASSTAHPAAAPRSAADALGWGPIVAGDEFDYVGPPRHGKWSVYDSAGNAGKGLRRPSQISVDGSKAIITGSSDGATGGMSAEFGRRRYGRWEIRMRVPFRDAQYHPVLILWPVNGNAPCDGEVDYAEGSENTSLMHFFDHYSCENRQTSTARKIDTTKWHTYAVQLTAAGVTGYLDGHRWFHDASHVPSTALHQTIQLDWFPDGTATRRSSMEVDWVRVYN